MATFATVATVAQHQNANPNGCFLVIGDGVYDVASFAPSHPGGADVLVDLKGKDASAAFRGVGHSAGAQRMMEKYRVGSCTETANSQVDGPALLTPEERAAILAEGRRGAWKSTVLPPVLGLLAAVATYVLVARRRGTLK